MCSATVNAGRSAVKSSLQGFFGLAIASLMLLTTEPALAHGHGAIVPHRLPSVEVSGELPAPPAGVSALKFGEFFRMPIGPLGLEASEKLLSLNGKRVRLVGYMVREENPAPGRLLLSPLPVSLGDEDESLSDDLPPTTVYVHLENIRQRNAPYIPGLIHLTGTLEVGAKDEEEGRVSTVRLILDPSTSKRFMSAKPLVRSASK